jgi:hypothetical protein
MACSVLGHRIIKGCPVVDGVSFEVVAVDSGGTFY